MASLSDLYNELLMKIQDANIMGGDQDTGGPLPRDINKLANDAADSSQFTAPTANGSNSMTASNGLPQNLGNTATAGSSKGSNTFKDKILPILLKIGLPTLAGGVLGAQSGTFGPIAGALMGASGGVSGYYNSEAQREKALKEELGKNQRAAEKLGFETNKFNVNTALKNKELGIKEKLAEASIEAKAKDLTLKEKNINSLIEKRLNGDKDKASKFTQIFVDLRDKFKIPKVDINDPEQMNNFAKIIYTLGMEKNEDTLTQKILKNLTFGLYDANGKADMEALRNFAETYNQIL